MAKELNALNVSRMKNWNMLLKMSLPQTADCRGRECVRECVFCVGVSVSVGVSVCLCVGG